MTLFCDLDGVLADFDRGVKEITGKFPREFRQIGDMWRQLTPKNTSDFYYKLHFMSDGPELWNAIKHLNPTILTGLPMGKWAHGQKVRWVGERLGWQVPIITGMTSDKPLHAKPGDFLIDDRPKIKPAWEQKGATFITHTDTASTLVALRDLGVL